MGYPGAMKAPVSRAGKAWKENDVAKETTYRGMWGDWQSLAAKLEVNQEELGHLETLRLKLAALVIQAMGISQQQDAMRASKQEFSKQLRKIAAEGNRLAALLRAGVKEHYGIREEKIAEFGLQPFRGRKAKTAAEEPGKPNPEPPDSTKP